ncbi:hypothetical protein J1C56_02065 [Aminobacter anthyllidis]|uniref:Uncharacterized protein n=1 Tax=Aminobacter anthyllidis TaxID=1035067 RepID=A0A9X1A793_9HYPH|nr:hypothetical protein [Aminobacter anthyllidis]MBT1154370.1 hypothetical protein [Aminobacter anthyllidis]
MDKRRYVSKSPRNPRTPVSIAADETGNAASDGYTARYRKSLDHSPSSGRYSEDFACGGLMDENEARWGRLYGDD